LPGVVSGLLRFRDVSGWKHLRRESLLVRRAEVIRRGVCRNENRPLREKVLRVADGC
jgi:hypothetical protein